MSPRAAPESKINQKSDYWEDGESKSLASFRLLDEKARFRRPQYVASIPSFTIPSLSCTHCVGSQDDYVDDTLDDYTNAEFNSNTTINDSTDDLESNNSNEHQHRDEDKIIIPGAFAINGIGASQSSTHGIEENDDAGDHILSQVYHSDFEGPNDIVSVVDNVSVDLADRLSVVAESDYLLDGSVNGDSDNITTIVVGSGCGESVELSNTPLQAQLYEVETTIAAEVLIEENNEDLGKKKFRTLSTQISVIIFLLLLVAGIVMGAVIPRSRATNMHDINSDFGDNIPSPVVEGWELVGEILTFEDAYKDNIRFGNAVAISNKGNRIAVGLPGSDNPNNSLMKNTGSVQIFDLVNKTRTTQSIFNDSTWNDTAKWIKAFEAHGNQLNDEFGKSVALSNDGKRLAIGAPGSGTLNYVLIYQEVDDKEGSWSLAGKIRPSPESNSKAFGDAIGFSSDGRVVAIADKYADQAGGIVQETGAVQVYNEVQHGIWEEKGNPIYGLAENSLFGWSISLSGDGSRVSASTLSSNGDAGNVRTFDFDEESEDWIQVGSTLFGDSARELFGASVKLSEGALILAVGAPGYSRNGEEADVGIVRVYQLDEKETTWLPYGQPLEGTNAFDAFGSAVALNSVGDVVAVGAPLNDDFCDTCGHIQVYENNGGIWNITGSSIGMVDTAGGHFGESVDLSGAGDRMVGGAPFTIQDGYWSKVGEVLVFDAINHNVTNTPIIEGID